jgi:hypothetical protein
MSGGAAAAASPSLAHLGLHLLQSLRAADAELHLVRLRQPMMWPPPICTPGQSLATSALQYFIASACWASAFDPADASAPSATADPIVNRRMLMSSPLLLVSPPSPVHAAADPISI